MCMDGPVHSHLSLSETKIYLEKALCANGCWLCCRRVFFEDLVTKAKEKQIKEEKRMKLVAEDFTDLLRSRHVKHDSVWDDIKPQIDHKERFKAVSINITV